MLTFSYSKDRSPSVSRLWRVRGILRCHLRVAACSLFRVRVPGTFVAGVADAGAPVSDRSYNT
jgi:hypothetical protein